MACILHAWCWRGDPDGLVIGCTMTGVSQKVYTWHFPCMGIAESCVCGTRAQAIGTPDERAPLLQGRFMPRGLVRGGVNSLMVEEVAWDSRRRGLPSLAVPSSHDPADVVVLVLVL